MDTSPARDSASRIGGPPSNGPSNGDGDGGNDDNVVRFETPPHGLFARLGVEIRSHPFGYAVLFAFLVIGPFGVTFLFPQAPPAVAIVGGLAFGAYAALCAVPQKFL